MPPKRPPKTSLLGTLGLQNALRGTQKQVLTNPQKTHTAQVLQNLQKPLQNGWFFRRQTFPLTWFQHLGGTFRARPPKSAHYDLQKLPFCTPFYLRFKAFLLPLTAAPVNGAAAFHITSGTRVTSIATKTASPNMPSQRELHL